MSYEEACEILDITPHTRHKAVFLSEEPPVDPLRAQSRTDSDPYEFDANITEIHETEE